MSIKKVLRYGDPILRIKSKEVSKLSKKVQALISDLIDTMYAYNGVGLAAPQIGVNLRVFVIDVTDPKHPPSPIVFINPKIIKKEGATNSYEGCLSFPQAYTNVRRYKNVMVKAQDKFGRNFVLEGTNGELLSRAIQHEFDHLDGVLFIDHARNRFEADKILKENNLPLIDSARILEESELENLIESEQKSDND